MKKKIVFTLKCFVVLFPLIRVMLYSKYNLIKFASSEQPLFIRNEEFINADETQGNYFEVLILGDSVANCSFMPEVLSGTTFNISLPGATPLENYYTLEDYLNHHNPPKSIYISFADQDFVPGTTFWRYSLFAHKFSFRQELEIIANSRKFSDESSNIFIEENSSYTDFFEYRIYFPTKYITELINGSLNQRLEENTEKCNKWLLHKGKFYLLSNNVGGDTGMEFWDFSISEIMDYYYKKLLDLCKSNNINVHLVKLPVRNDCSFSENYVNQVYDYYNNLISDYSNVTFDWFIDGFERFYYVDRIHMNTHGSLKFSLEIKRMYPEEFNDNFTKSQIEAINDNITNENTFNEMFNWASLGPYTFLVYDNSGIFGTLYENSLKKDNLICSTPPHMIMKELKSYTAFSQRENPGVLTT